MQTAVMAKPGFWLAGQGVVLLLLCLLSDTFLLYPVDLDGYRATLRQMEQTDLGGILANVRTFAYPLFLKIVSFFSPWLDALPFWQLVVRILAVWAFHVSLVRVQLRPWLALCMASSLLYTNAIFSHDMCLRVTQVMTDVMGESLLILTVSCLLLALSEPERIIWWLGYAVCLFLTYQMRPAYLFLAVLLPILGTLIRGMVVPRGEWLRLRLRIGFFLLLLSLGPLLGWFTMRLLVVGHFGLVSYTGNTLCGVAGQLLTEEVIPEVADSVQPFLKAVLTRRDQILNGDVPGQRDHYQPAFDDKGQLQTGVVEDVNLYVFTQVELFQITATEFYGSPSDPLSNVVIDRKQLEAALELIKARPWQYAQWVLASLRATPAKVVLWNVVLSVLLTLLALAGLVWHLLYVFQWLRGAPKIEATVSKPILRYTWELNLMLLLGLGVVFGQLLLIAALAPAAGSRYCDTAGVFLCPAAVVALASMLRQIQALLPEREARLKLRIGPFSISFGEGS